MSVAGAGETLLTADAAAAARLDGSSVRSCGHWRFKGIEEPIELFATGSSDASLRDGDKAYRVQLVQGEWRPVRSVPHHLPRPLTNAIGRGRDVFQVDSILRERRLLTLIGTGGLGKSRLALQVGSHVMGEFPDGAWFVDLAAAATPESIVQAVASLLGVVEEAAATLSDRLLHYLAHRKLLLILDNCEQVLDACAALAGRMLAAAERLTILATSRERLNVAGEAVYRVPPLDVPDAAARDVARIGAAASVQLFCERAATARPGFVLRDDNAGCIAEICRRLDGIPLAIELAAVRTGTLSTEQISARLDDRFRLLQGGHRAALPRQQTLRSLIDWSHDLLSDAERTLFRRLAVFSGGWTLDSAEAVCTDPATCADDVVDLVAGLVDKSLVAFEADQSRYRMLETLRHYADERLRSSGEERALRDRHLEHFGRLARERAASTDHGWIDAEHDNLAAALAWCDRSGADAQAGLELLLQLIPQWLRRGRLTFAYDSAAQTLGRTAGLGMPRSRLTLMLLAGQLAYFSGRYELALKHGEESLAVARNTADTPRIFAALSLLGLVATARGDRADARKRLNAALGIAREANNASQAAVSLNGLAELARLEGDLDGALPLYSEASMLARSAGDRDAEAPNTLSLALLELCRGRIADARRLNLEGLELAAAAGSARLGISALDICAGIAASAGRPDLAATLLGVVQSMSEHAAVRRDPADDLVLAPLLSASRTALGVEAFDAAVAAGRAMSLDEARDLARPFLAEH